ncbi:hypothetical protein TspCOW1_15160 [Thiohalobacter sp. COW1]|uniref:Cytochrome c n=1 Tax=Thiohalobacter thiocyanaticus TaxID=585455 RepID=A0A1Z4VPX3_9GAMM|nr:MULTISPECIES: hypothetical protein [Thiohalobacter]BAZ93545.1 uncharacterized protein FOKN1_1146 [Thiohalobacter thiocyanaticus]BCO31413.1 hypothetical protein TspCOW1_15160 [Thiohalobacter sp. COW1]
MNGNRSFVQRFGWPLLSGILALMLAGVLALLLLPGRVAETPSSDGRMRLLLEPAERDYVLAEMRDLLAAVQVITEAGLDGDMERVAEHARRMGMGGVRNIPPEIRAGLLRKLPAEFRQLGFSVHQGMDAIALDAESLGDPEHSLRQLSNLMNTCIACHSGYTVMPPPTSP